MKNLLNILGVILFSITIISCGNNENNENSDKHKLLEIKSTKEVIENPAIYSKATSFEYDSNTKTITSIELSSLHCSDEEDITFKAIMRRAKGKVIFRSTNDASEYRAKSKFKQQVEGVLVIGKKEFKANFLHEISARENGAMFFSGIITFQNNSVFEHVSDEVNIFVKGKK